MQMICMCEVKIKICTDKKNCCLILHIYVDGKGKNRAKLVTVIFDLKTMTRNVNFTHTIFILIWKTTKILN